MTWHLVWGSGYRSLSGDVTLTRIKVHLGYRHHIFCIWKIVFYICFKMVRFCCVNVCNSWLHDLKDQNLTTKKDMLGLALEKRQNNKRRRCIGWPGFQRWYAKSSYLPTNLRVCSFTLYIFIKISKRCFRCAYFLISEVANIIFTCYSGLSMLLNNQGAGEHKRVM